MSARPVTRKYARAATTTSTGNSTWMDFNGFGYSVATIYHKSVGSTKNIAFKVQGSVSDSDIWFDLMAATTGSTAGATINTTAGKVFDKVRVNVTADASTGNTALSVWIVPKTA